MCVNWNGAPSPSFASSRGLCQGDPISPYLFVLSMERLGHRIQEAITAGVWKPMTFGRGQGPNISHIFFANDLVLIAEASHSQVNLIRNILDDFCRASGQKVNLSKSLVYFFNNVNEDLAASLSHSLGITCTKDLGRYLGFPLLHQRVTKQTFSFLLDKMRSKLSSWKANSLSFAGLVTLAQSSLASLPGYTMQACSLPVSICDEAEKICRDFIWGSSPASRKCHLIS